MTSKPKATTSKGEKKKDWIIFCFFGKHRYVPVFNVIPKIEACFRCGRTNQ